MKILKAIITVVITVLLITAITGFVKFNIIQDDIYTENEAGEIVPLK